MKKNKFETKLDKIIHLHLTKLACDEVWMNRRINELITKMSKYYENQNEKK